MDWWIIFIIFLFAAFAVYNDKFKYWLQTQENYTEDNDNIIFLSKNELEDILIADNDNFYDKFNKVDY